MNHTQGFPVLIGRDVELAQIKAAVDGAARQGRTLRIAGQAGAGKSALLRAGVEFAAARGFTTLTVQAAESESHLAFAALYQLLQPLLGRAGKLPASRQASLNSAFGLAESGGGPDNPFFIALAALELIADAAAQTPVFISVDDLPWLDKASLDALEFISRRIADERIVMVTTCRLNRPPESTYGSDLLWLDALDSDACRALLRGTAPDLSAADQAWVLDAAAGNPLALLELAKAVGRSGESSVFAPVPLTERLERAFAVRLDDLDSRVRTALLVTALQDSDRLPETRAALCQLLGDHPDVGLHEVARLGMLTIEGDAFRLRHPLVRSAIIQSATLAERRAVHQALAVVLSHDPDRAVWHSSLAAPAPQEPLAAALDEGACRAAARGAPRLAQEWLMRAAELSEDDRSRGHRLLRAAELALELGHREVVAELTARARMITLDPTDYARLVGIDGAFDGGIPGDENAIGQLIDAASRAHQGGEVELAASLLLHASNSWCWGAAGEPLRRRILAVSDELCLDARVPHVMAMHSQVDPFAFGKHLVDQLTHWASRPVDDVRLLVVLARTGFLTGDFERGLSFARRASDGLRSQGRIALLAWTLVLEAMTSLYLGRWDVTLVACDEAYRFGVETRQPMWTSIAQLAQGCLAGLRGDAASALSVAADVEMSAVREGNHGVLSAVQLTRGLAALGDGRPGAAVDEFLRMIDPGDVAYHYSQCTWVIDYLAEAAMLSGRGQEVLEALHYVEELADDTPASGVVRALAYARAVLADDEHAEELFACASQLKAGAPPWYRARIDLAYGSWLRRHRRMAESRQPLTSAQVVFDALGASAWSARASQELAATGRRPRQHEPDAWATLSAQELQVALLAAQGLTNREIGERLYLSHRTVGSHLYRLFPKLGVRSRNQLHLALDTAPGLGDDSWPGR